MYKKGHKYDKPDVCALSFVQYAPEFLFSSDFCGIFTLLTSNNTFVFLSYKGTTQRSKAWMKAVLISHKLNSQV